MFEFWHEFKNNCKCIVMVPYGGTHRMFKIKWVPQSKATFDLKTGKINHTYNLILKEAIMSKKNNPILFYELDKTEPIHLNGVATGKSSNLYNTILKNKEAEEILTEGKNKNMFIIIGLFVIVIIAVGLYSQYQLSVANDKILALTNKILQLYANSTKSVVIR